MALSLLDAHLAKCAPPVAECLNSRYQRGTPTARVTLRTGQEDNDGTLTDGVLTDDPVEAALVKAQRGAGLL